jgi:hypothetical protein
LDLEVDHQRDSGLEDVALTVDLSPESVPEFELKTKPEPSPPTAPEEWRGCELFTMVKFTAPIVPTYSPDNYRSAGPFSLASADNSPAFALFCSVLSRGD